MSLTVGHFHHGSASVFTKWIEYLAQKIFNKDLDAIGKESNVAEHPLYLLFEHSDCEGYIHWNLCKPIADSLSDFVRSELGLKPDFVVTKESILEIYRNLPAETRKSEEVQAKLKHITYTVPWIVGLYECYEDHSCPMFHG